MSFGHRPQGPMQPSNPDVPAHRSPYHPTTLPVYTRANIPSSQSRTSISTPPSSSTQTRAQNSHMSSTNFTPASSSTSPVSYPYQSTPSPLHPHPTPPSSPSSPLVFDMKRLLAKPAPPYTRSHYGYGSGSESEGGYSFSDSGAPSGSAHPRKHRDQEHAQERALREISFDKGSPLDLSFEVEAGPPHHPMTTFRTRSESGLGVAAESTKERRVRNVLKRRPSTTTVASPVSNPRSTTSTPLPSALPQLVPISPLMTSIMTSVPSRRPTTAPTPGMASLHMLSVPSTSKTTLPRSPTTSMSRSAFSTTMKTKNDHRVDNKTSNIPTSPNTRPAINDPRNTTTNYTADPMNSVHRNLSPHPPSSRSRSSSRHATAPMSSTPHLTPAGAVVEAYKRQEEARHAAVTAAETNGNHHNLTGFKVGNDENRHSGGRLLHPPPARLSHSPYGSLPGSASESGLSLGLLSMTTGADAEDAYGGMESGFDVIQRVVGAQQQHRNQHHSDPTSATEEEEAKVPYYTIFGSSSERVIAVGSPEDRHHSMFAEASGVGRHTSATATASGTAGSGAKTGGGGLAKTLSRKVSGRWRRAPSGVEMSGEDANGVRRRVSMSVEGGMERDREKGKDRGRPSLQERRIGKFVMAERDRSTQQSQKRMASLGIGDRRSLRLSIDNFAEETLPPSLATPVTPVKPIESEPDVWGAQQQQRLKAKGSDSGNDASPASGSASGSGTGGGSKIWKLVKRISAGGLRERYKTLDAPPVPALPKEYSTSPSGPLKESGGSRSAEHAPSHHQHHKEASVALATPSPPMSRFMPSRSSSTGAPRVSGIVRSKSSQVITGSPEQTKTSPQTRPHASSSSSSLLQSPTRTTLATAPAAPSSRPSPSNSNTRPSTTTRSSSPNSSDVASSRFFSGYSHRQSSMRSSASSLFGDEVPPPMPKLNVGQHIIPPSELGKMHSDDGYTAGAEVNPSLVNVKPIHEKLRLVMPGAPFPTGIAVTRPSDDWMIVNTPAEDLASLPFPPRRPIRHHQAAHSEALPAPTSSSSNNSSTSDLSMSIRSANDEGDHEVGRAGSPGIPSFSTVDPINAFAPARRMSSDTRRSKPSPPTSAKAGMSTYQQSPLSAPPPRPLRSAQRPPPAPLSVNSQSRSTPTSPADTNNTYSTRRVPVPLYDPTVIPRTPISPNTSRHSTSGQSATSTATVRPSLLRRRSSSATDSLSSPPRRTMMFRELGKGKTLSEKEKAERWEDLLERSARAGGTLHFGGEGGEDGLRSDRLRFSEISEVL